MSVRGYFGALVFTFIAHASFAENARADWQFFGNNVAFEPARCFFEANGLIATPNGHVKVRTKCLSESAMDIVNIQKDYDGRIFKAAMVRLALPYNPPYSNVEKLNDSERILVVVWEQIADIAQIKPDAKISYEIDCSSKMLRALTFHMDVKGQRVGSQMPSDWDHMPPDSDGAWLLKIVCLSR